MTLTSQHVGKGDRQFTGIHLVLDGKSPVAVYIPNAGMSGGNYYKLGGKLMEAVERVKSTDTGPGHHVAQFAKVITSEGFNAHDSRGDGFSTSVAAGSNRAMGMVHETLQRQGLLIGLPTPEMKHAVWPQMRVPGHVAAPGRPGAPVQAGAKPKPA